MDKTIVILLVLVTVFFVSVQYVEAQEEKTNEFYGLDNMLEDPNSIVKFYKSGGFSLKNYDFGIAIFAHPTSETGIFKFVVLENGKVSRFLAEMESPSSNNVIVEPTVKPKTIYPKSSVGSDITKYDIPTHNPRAEKKSMLIGISGDRIDKLHLGNTYEKTFKVYDVRNNTPIIGADVTLEISRDEFIHKKIVKQSSQGGLIHFKIPDLDYPLFYPRFCYDVKVVVTFGNTTQAWTDEFLMEYKLGARVWEPNMNWIGESRWNYLPSSFTDEPRQSILADSHCN